LPRLLHDGITFISRHLWYTDNITCDEKAILLVYTQEGTGTVQGPAKTNSCSSALISIRVDTRHGIQSSPQALLYLGFSAATDIVGLCDRHEACVLFRTTSSRFAQIFVSVSHLENGNCDRNSSKSNSNDCLFEAKLQFYHEQPRKINSSV
jgi:hypothetical protein